MASRHNLALIMNEHSYAGREYLSKLKDFNIDVICIGSFPKISTTEEERNGKEIICTVHKLTKNIDAGPIIFKKRLNVNLDSYQKFRSSIYPEISILVREILCKTLLDEQFICDAKPQDETKAKYWPYHGEENLKNINQIFETK